MEKQSVELADATLEQLGSAYAESFNATLNMLAGSGGLLMAIEKFIEKELLIELGMDVAAGMNEVTSAIANGTLLEQYAYLAYDVPGFDKETRQVNFHEFLSNPKVIRNFRAMSAQCSRDIGIAVDMIAEAKAKETLCTTVLNLHILSSEITKRSAEVKVDAEQATEAPALSVVPDYDPNQNVE